MRRAKPRKVPLATFLEEQVCSQSCCSRSPKPGEKSASDEMPSKSPRCATHLSGLLSVLIGKGKQSRSTFHSSSGEEWKAIDAILDSGASVTVIRPHMAGGYEVRESAASRAGVHYEVANGDEIPNLGVKSFPVVTE